MIKVGIRKFNSHHFNDTEVVTIHNHSLSEVVETFTSKLHTNGIDYELEYSKDFSVNIKYCQDINSYHYSSIEINIWVETLDDIVSNIISLS